jgi:tRNA pseudouridine55 synthase
MRSGILVVDKPQGPTSHDVVAAARRALGERRIGHCGTLDPLATGVLALAIGQATRLVQFLSGEAKHYEAVVRFGQETTTYDSTGEVVTESTHRPSRDDLETALAGFRGPLMQVPPAYSAKKVAGVRAYARARQHPHHAEPLRPVPVTCHELSLTGFDGERASLRMRVSAGFYVRSLAHNLGRALGSGAVLESLRRTRSGEFALDAAVPFDELVRGDRDAMAARVMPIARLLPRVPALSLSGEASARVRHGMDIPLPPDWPATFSLVRLLSEDGRLLALAVPADRPGFLHPSVVLG